MNIYNLKVEIPSDFKNQNSEKWSYESSDLKIDTTEDINKQCCELPSLISQWYTILAKYVRLLKDLEIDKEVWLSHRKTDVRNKLQSKATESYITECVIANNPLEYAKYDKDIADVVYYIDSIKSVCKALDAKVKMLEIVNNNKNKI